MKLVITLWGTGTPQRINVHLAEETPGALAGLAVMSQPVEVEFSEPIIALGARIEGVNG